MAQQPLSQQQCRGMRSRTALSRLVVIIANATHDQETSKCWLPNQYMTQLMDQNLSECVRHEEQDSPLNG